MPTRLIEVRDSAGMDCLRLRASDQLEHSAYTPLSYCWGGDQSIKSTTEQISKWMKAIPYQQLPRTLQDAVTVCRHLQVRFLWVDAICIIQDNEIDKAQQIAQMPQIYNNAYFTIIAASASSASQGFLGERTAPHSGTLAFDLPYLCPDGQQGSVTLFQLEPLSDPIDTRAWTLQERLLSPRAVEFSHHQVRWVCLQAAGRPGWSDGWRVEPEQHLKHQDFLPKGVYSQAFGVPLPLDRRTKKDGVFKTYPKFDWYTLVETYTTRSLAIPGDRILALSGLAKEYCALFEDTYLAGLWRKSLFRELFWCVDGPKQAAPTTFQGPSWSWTSVNGSIDFKAKHYSNPPPEQAYVAEIVDCNPMLVEDGALFGAVEEVASSLVLRARLLPALLSSPQPSNTPGSNETEDFVLLMKMNDCTGLKGLKINLDTSDIRVRYPELANFTTPLMLLELESYFLSSGQPWHVKGLVLRGEAVAGGSREAALKRRLADKAKLNNRKDTHSTSLSNAELGLSPDGKNEDSYKPAQVAMLRYQFRRHLGEEVSLWSDDEVRNYARDKDKCLNLLMTPRHDKPEAVAVRKPDEQVFYRVGIFEFQNRYKSDYDPRALSECDWFKYCVPHEVTIL
jgi:Heterokaryon incompatibility protein (HET)